MRSAQARVAARREQEAAQQPELPPGPRPWPISRCCAGHTIPSSRPTCPGRAYAQDRCAGYDTRWGSCSLKTGTLALLRRLCVAPAAQEYVVVHEFCHFAHPNHGPGFWAAVAAVMPDYKARERLLKQM